MSNVLVAQESNRATHSSSGPDVERRAGDRGAPSSVKQGGQGVDSWRWSDAGADAFSLVLTRCVGSMTPVEDQYSPVGLPRAARFNMCLDMWYRVDGDPEWRRGTTANLSRSGVLFHASGVDAFPPQRRTDPDRAIDIIIEVSKGVTPSQVHCRATVARVVEPGSSADPGAVAVTVGDYVLLAS